MAAWAKGDAALAKGNWETFKLSELRLDQKNFRLGEQDSQRAAILEMIDDQKQKLVRLARDLMEVGPSPGEPVWVTKDTKNRGQYIILEGNRRVTALKLMENPALADGTLVEKHFQNLSKLYLKKPIRELEALVFATREDAQPWIRRRHMTAASGVGLQRWEPLAKGRADKAHGLRTPRFLAVIEFLGEDTEAWNTVYGALDDKWTTLDRVLSAKAMNEMLGVTFDLKKGTVRFDNGDTSAGRKLLWRRRFARRRRFFCSHPPRVFSQSRPYMPFGNLFAKSQRLYANWCTISHLQLPNGKNRNDSKRRET